MELSLPADVYVLRVMSDGEPNNPVRVQHLIAERHASELDKEWNRDPWTRAYVSQVLARLRDRELLERVPPENSGLYRITDMGRAALEKFIETGETSFSFRELDAAAENLPEEPALVPANVTLTRPDSE